MIPIRTDRQLRHTPWVNYALIAANAVVFVVFQKTGTADAAMREFLLYPDEPHVIQFFSSMFMHAGWMHLLGNMLFLWVFGNAVNDTLGSVGYLAFYLGGGVEYEFNAHERIKPYINGGPSIGFLDADDISGTSATGAPFTIKSDPGTEFIPFLTAGIRWNLWRNLSLDLAAKAEYHIADWEVKDTASNQKATIDDYAAFGGYLGVAFHF